MDLNELKQTICEILNIKKTTRTIEGQINRFVIELGYSYQEIAQALVFFKEVEEGNLDPKYGIGIVPHIIEKSKEYYKKLEKQKQRQIQSVKEANKTPNIILKPNNLKRKRKLAKINIDDIKVDID